MHRERMSRKKEQGFRFSDFEDIARIPRRAAVAAAAALKSKAPATSSPVGTMPGMTVPATTAKSGALESKPSKGAPAGDIESSPNSSQTKGKKDGGGRRAGRGGDDSGSKRKSSSCSNVVAASTADASAAAVVTSCDVIDESKVSGGGNRSDTPRNRGNDERRIFAAERTKKPKVPAATSFSKSAGKKGRQDNESSTSSKTATVTTSGDRRQASVESNASSSRKLGNVAIGPGASFPKNPDPDQPNQASSRSNGCSAAGGVIENGTGKDSSEGTKMSSGDNKDVRSSGKDGVSTDSTMVRDEEGMGKVLEPKTMYSREDKGSTSAKSCGDGTPSQRLREHDAKAEASPMRSSSGRRRAPNVARQSRSVHEDGASFGASPYPRRIR